GIYLELGRQNDDLARIRARLRRLELETDKSVRARQVMGDSLPKLNRIADDGAGWWNRCASFCNLRLRQLPPVSG
ncbi:MAG: hypothetical protein OQK92_00990, partial [Sedimenticola sp.]|nr:hypothetical protein [Sedimenticola sp.]